MVMMVVFVFGCHLVSSIEEWSEDDDDDDDNCRR